MDTDEAPQCDQLYTAAFQDLVLVRGSEAYMDREASYWAANSPLHPNFIVQPRSTQEVAHVVKALAESNSLVALRSGGHTQWTGANDIRGGVTIDLGRMTAVTYNSQSKLASIQPGPRWGDVYEALLEHGVCVPGGRDGNVGIGGFLTEGGNSYYAGLYGWDTDNVANYEVVLADGSVVNANAKSHSDLFKALREAKDIWGGIRAAVRSEGDKLAQAMVEFTNNNKKNPEDAHIINYTFNPSSGPDVLVAHVVVDTNGVVNVSAFEKILEVPVVMNGVKKRTMANMANSYLLPSDEQQFWFTLTFKNDVRVIKKVGMLHDDLVGELKRDMPAGNYSTQCFFQPVPTLFAEHSIQRGGNVLGLDDVKQNALLWLITGSTQTVEQQKIMRQKLARFSTDLDEYAKSFDPDVDWQYLNYVDQTQNPLKSYGQKNVDFILKVSAKYDPSQLFQRKIVSGWKISKTGI